MRSTRCADGYLSNIDNEKVAGKNRPRPRPEVFVYAAAMTPGITISTAADFLRVGNLLNGFCLNQACGHQGGVNLPELRPDLVVSGPDRAPMRCTACGGTKAQGIVTPAGAIGFQRQYPRR